MSLLFIVMLAFCPTNTAKAGEPHKQEMTLDNVSLEDDLAEIYQWELATTKHEAEDIFVKSTLIKQAIIDVSFYANYLNETVVEDDDYEYITITLTGPYENLQSLEKDIEAAVLKERPDIKSIKSYAEIYISTIICDVEYKYREELVIGEELGLPSTKADGKYELSPLTLYISRCRISYVIEDGGEFYIPQDDYDFLLWQTSGSLIDDAERLDIVENAYFNLDWKCFKNAGTVVGELNKIEKKRSDFAKDKYVIGHLTYYRLSDILEDWCTENRTLFKYNESTNTLYYGKRPLPKDKLQKDEIYDFVMKVTKGCTTDKEKLRAIYDAIVKKYDVRESMFYFRSFSGYDMRDNLFDAKKLMVDKKYSYDGFADFFKECCNRLMIPCDLVDNSYVYWNRVYLGDKIYHVDTGSAAIIYHATNALVPTNRFFLKSSYEFMGYHYWEGDDYTPEKFSRNWKNINRNNIKTTDELRRAATYASYLSKDGKKHTYTFKITGKNVNTYCEAYVYAYEYISAIKASYKNGILTITYN